MKKLTLSLLATCVLASSAMASPASFTWFTTKAQADAVCPSNITYSKPYLTGSKDGRSFVNIKLVVAPQLPLNINAYYNPTDNAYGYNSNGVITCFYTYTNTSGVKALVNLRGK